MEFWICTLWYNIVYEHKCSHLFSLGLILDKAVSCFSCVDKIGFTIPIGHTLVGSSPYFSDPYSDVNNINPDFDIYSFGVTLYILWLNIIINYINIIIVFFQ